MTSKQRFLATLAALATSSAMFVGCGGGPECGDGTREVDGECVLMGSTGACGEGTTLVNGACVLDPSGCPAGTSFDAAAGACVTTAEACGAGTTFDSGTGTCVPSSSIVCGEGTTEQNGTCVATGGGGAECATGTTLDSGRCIVSPAVCAGGTTLDAATNTCVLTGEACADGLALSGGVCVPTAEVCGAGAQFSEDTGLCLPEADCREGDVVLDGLCVPPAEALAADPAAVSIDGEDVVLGDLPAVGERAIFTGTLEDYDDEGNAGFDFDSFTFNGTAGQWVKLSVQTLGAPSPAFIVSGPEDTNGNSSYERLSSLGIENDPARLLLLPESGEYTVLVVSGYALASLFGGGGLDFFTASSPEFAYVGTVEQINAPTPKQITPTGDPTTSETMSGTNVLRLDENFFSVAGADADSFLKLNLTELQANVDGILQVWSSDGVFIEALSVAAGSEVLRPLPETGLLFVMDWYLTTTPGSTFTIETLIPNLVAVPAEVPAGSDSVIALADAPANSVIAARFAPGMTGSLTVSVLDADGEVLGRTTAISGDLKHYAFYSAGGDYSLRLENTSGTDFSGQVLVEVIIPEVLGNLSADVRVDSADIPLKGTSDNFFLVEDSRAGDVLGFSHISVESAVLTYTVHDVNGAIVVDGAAQLNERNFVRHYSTTGGSALVQVRNNSTLTRDLTMGGQRWTPFDLPEPGNPGYVPGDNMFYEHGPLVAEGDDVYLRVRLDERVRLTGGLASIDAGDPDLYIFDLDHDFVTGSFAVGDENLTNVFLRAGTYLFQINAYEELTDGFFVDIDFEEFGLVAQSPGTNTSLETAEPVPSFDHILLGTASDYLFVNDEFWSITVEGDDPIALNFTVTNAGGDGWGTFFLWNSSGQIITLNPGTVLFPGHTETVGAVLQPGQTYYLMMSGLFDEDDGEEFYWDYVVRIDELTGFTLEVESNDSFATANQATVGEGIAGTIVDLESDFYTFTVGTDGSYSIEALDFPGAEGDPTRVVVALFDVNEDVVVLDGTSSAILAAGTYYVEVYQEERQLVGNSYLLFINQN